MLRLFHYMAEPKRYDAAEQTTRYEDNEHKADQIIDFHRQEKLVSPGLFMKIVEVHLFFVTAVSAVGVLAYYGHHTTTMEIFFAASIVCVLAVPVALVWYLRVGTRRKAAIDKTADSGNLTLFARLEQYAIGRASARFVNNRIVRLVSFAPPVCLMAYAIIRFQMQPRFSLVMIVLYTALIIIQVTIEMLRALDNELQSQYNRAIGSINGVLSGVVGVLENTTGIATGALAIATSARTFIDDTEPGHQKAHADITAAIDAIHHTTEAMADTFNVQPVQVDAPPEMAAEPKSE